MASLLRESVFGQLSRQGYRMTGLSQERTRCPSYENDGSAVLVNDWDSHDDPENPRNWPKWKKISVVAQICIYTFVVYVGSAIYTACEPYVMVNYNVSDVKASLGLALYVLGYGFGAMIFCPCSEIPRLGRNIPYIATFGLFIVFSALVAKAKSIDALFGLRFLQGCFGSPALATGAASLHDMYRTEDMPVMLSLWISAAMCGPAIGPTIAAYSVDKGWRLPLWEILWMACGVWVVMFFCLPETFKGRILLSRAAYRAERTKTEHTYVEEHGQSLSPAALLMDVIWRPCKIMLTNPAVAFANLYTCLIYGTYYSFFESFPLVYPVVHQFSGKEMALGFLSIIIATAVAIPFYYYLTSRAMGNKATKVIIDDTERFLIPGLLGSVLISTGLFIYGWTALQHNIPWPASLFGVFLYSFGTFLVLQSLSFYIILVFPSYAASLFAGNDFLRSAVACIFILISYPLYQNLGVDIGVTILACGTVLCMGGIVCLYWQGAWLRARSRWVGQSS